MQSLQPKAIFTSQGRVVFYRGEGLCNQQTKVAEEITNTEPKGRYSYFVCANQHPRRGTSKQGKPSTEFNTSLSSRLCGRDSTEMSRLYFTSWQILDPPSEEDWPWRQEDAVGHAVLCDSEESLW